LEKCTLDSILSEKNPEHVILRAKKIEVLKQLYEEEIYIPIKDNLDLLVRNFQELQDTGFILRIRDYDKPEKVVDDGKAIDKFSKIWKKKESVIFEIRDYSSEIKKDRERGKEGTNSNVADPDIAYQNSLEKNSTVIISKGISIGNQFYPGNNNWAFMQIYPLEKVSFIKNSFSIHEIRFIESLQKGE
jgi:hypothetical protein